MDPISDHPVEHSATCRDLVAGQETHDARVAVVELGRVERGLGQNLLTEPGPDPPRFCWDSPAAWR